MKNKIEILLPTYNGSRYLPEQLDSLCNQTFSDFTVITYDDGSTDNSVATVERYTGQLAIKRIPNNSGSNIGAIKSFEMLLHHATAEYIMFCDQDDIWERNKIELCVMALSDSIKCYGNIPILIFSDLLVFSEHQHERDTSFLSSTGFNPATINDPYYLAFRNPAPGCAITVNRALINTAQPILSTALMHDWWLMLSASLTGRIVFIDKKLVRYRIHQSNTLGIAQDRPKHPIRSIAGLLQPAKRRSIINRLEPGLQQAETVFGLHGKHFSRLRFWIKLVAGRYIFPYLIKVYPPMLPYSWKRPPHR